MKLQKETWSAYMSHHEGPSLPFVKTAASISSVVLDLLAEVDANLMRNIYGLACRFIPLQGYLLSRDLTSSKES